MSDTSRKERLAMFQKEIQDAAGEEHFRLASERPAEVPVIPVNCFELDSMLGGGFVAGAVHMLWGQEAGGKTTTALKAIASLHKKCANCLTFIRPRPVQPPEDNRGGRLTKWEKERLKCKYCGECYHLSDRPPIMGDQIDDDEVPDSAQFCEGCGVIEEGVLVPVPPTEEGEEEPEFEMPFGESRCECGDNEPTMALFMDFENRLDKRWAATLGVDLSRMIHEVPAYGEQGIDIVRRAIVEGLVDAIVIDSVANISAAEEMLNTAGDRGSWASTARMVNRFLRSLPGWQVEARDKWGLRVTVFAINQVRTDVNASAFESGDVAFGGKGQKFAASTITKFVYSKADKDEVTVGNAKKHEKMGLSSTTTMTVTCEKSSRSSSRGLTRRVKLVTANDGLLRKGEFDDYKATWKQGRVTKVISKGEDGWEVPNWPQTFPRDSDLKAELHSNQFFKMHVHSEIIRKIHEGDWATMREFIEKEKSS